MNNDQAILIEAVRGAESLPVGVRERASTVQHCEWRIFDRSYLDFLAEQIALEARGAAWTAILTERLAALSPFCDAPTLSGTISTPMGDYQIRVDPMTRKLIHHEQYETTGHG